MGVESVMDGKAIGEAITQSAETCDMVGLVSILSQIAMGFIILVTMLSKSNFDQSKEGRSTHVVNGQCFLSTSQNNSCHR